MKIYVYYCAKENLIITTYLKPLSKTKKQILYVRIKNKKFYLSETLYYIGVL